MEVVAQEITQKEAEHPKPKEKEQKHKKQKENKQSNSELASLQHALLRKEHEIGKLQKHIDRQVHKNEEVKLENEQIREQLKLSSDQHHLKKTIEDLNQ